MPNPYDPITRLAGLEYAAYYSKSAESRAAVVNGIAAHKRAAGEIDRVCYLAPKKALDQVRAAVPDAEFYAYEDVASRTNEPFNRADDRTLLVYDRCARYGNILTSMFSRLSRLSLRYRYKLLVDIVPFTRDIQYLYVPISYLHRRILGHQHWYAFRENYRERTASGELVSGHDYRLLAEKLAPCADIDYDRFLPALETVACPLTSEEDSGYQTIREELFARHQTAGPIITRLADWVNMRESRYAALARLLSGLSGRVLAYTNIASHNAQLRRRFQGLEVRTFYDANGDEGTAAHVILFEVPIVKSYLWLDVLANLAPHCRVWLFASGAPVDRYLLGKASAEYQAVDRFTQTLWEVLRDGA